ncbi:MAG: hypothetical protein ACI4DY_08265 [Monoglobaceae bacterium]
MGITTNNVIILDGISSGANYQNDIDKSVFEVPLIITTQAIVIFYLMNAV